MVLRSQFSQNFFCQGEKLKQHQQDKSRNDESTMTIV